MPFSRKDLDLDCAAEAARLEETIRRQVLVELRREGAVVGVSGGLDSSVTAALCARALGPEKVVAIMMPEKDSNPESTAIAERLAARLGIEPILEDITAPLEGLGAYRRRDEAVRRLFPDYGPEHKVKIVLPGQDFKKDTINLFRLGVVGPDGEERSRRMPLREYLQIVAASNMKQRTRMITLYYHAEVRNYAVVGTANLDEHDQGFFVKHGDGGVDLQPIAHLYKLQVYQLARHLDIPEEILERTPTTDTYSAEVTQEEFFFRLPFDMMDPILYAMDHGVKAAETARELGLTEEQVTLAFKDFERKKRATEYLRTPPLKAGRESID